jgi:hypothetical protein
MLVSQSNIANPWDYDVFNDMRGFEKLQHYIYREFVEDWKSRRGLRGGDRPVFQPWRVVVGKPNGNNQVFKVKDQASWETVHIQLRLRKHNNDKKNCGSLLIEAPYQTFNRESSPIAVVDSKAHPKSQRYLSFKIIGSTYIYT